MSGQSSQFYIWTIAWLVVDAMVAPWVEQSRQSGWQRIGQPFG